MLVVAGSRNLSHFDAPLMAYTFASLFAAGGIIYRYSIWLQRPPTALYWRRGWTVFPLVFGWLAFEWLPDNVDSYRILVFGFPTISLPSGSFVAGR